MKTKVDLEKRIGSINNYYGGLTIGRIEGVPHWSIENYDGYEWEEISENLYEELLKHKSKDSDDLIDDQREQEAFGL